MTPGGRTAGTFGSLFSRKKAAAAAAAPLTKATADSSITTSTDNSNNNHRNNNQERQRPSVTWAEFPAFRDLPPYEEEEEEEQQQQPTTTTTTTTTTSQEEMQKQVEVNVLLSQSAVTNDPNTTATTKSSLDRPELSPQRLTTTTTTTATTTTTTAAENTCNDVRQPEIIVHRQTTVSSDITMSSCLQTTSSHSKEQQQPKQQRSMVTLPPPPQPSKSHQAKSNINKGANQPSQVTQKAVPLDLPARTPIRQPTLLTLQLPITTDDDGGGGSLPNTTNVNNADETTPPPLTVPPKSAGGDWPAPKPMRQDTEHHHHHELSTTTPRWSMASSLSTSTFFTTSLEDDEEDTPVVFDTLPVVTPTDDRPCRIPSRQTTVGEATVFSLDASTIPNSGSNDEEDSPVLFDTLPVVTPTDDRPCRIPSRQKTAGEATLSTIAIPKSGSEHSSPKSKKQEQFLEAQQQQHQASPCSTAHDDHLATTERPMNAQMIESWQSMPSPPIMADHSQFHESFPPAQLHSCKNNARCLQQLTMSLQIPKRPSQRGPTSS